MSRFILGCDEGVHKFEPRYNSKWPEGKSFPTASGDNIIGLIEAIKTQTYIHDICVKCGATVKPTQGETK